MVDCDCIGIVLSCDLRSIFVVCESVVLWLVFDAGCGTCVLIRCTPINLLLDWSLSEMIVGGVSRGSAWLFWVQFCDKVREQVVRSSNFSDLGWVLAKQI
jgi:hypothetical protein